MRRDIWEEEGRAGDYMGGEGRGGSPWEGESKGWERVWEGRGWLGRLGKVSKVRGGEHIGGEENKGGD